MNIAALLFCMPAHTVREEYKELERRIYEHRPAVIHPDYVLALYRYWAKIDAIENMLVKKGLLSRKEINEAMRPILVAMQTDFAGARRAHRRQRSGTISAAVGYKVRHTARSRSASKDSAGIP